MGDVAEPSSREIPVCPLASTDEHPNPGLITPIWNRFVDAFSLRAEVAGILIAFGLIVLLALREAYLGRVEVALAAPRDLFISIIELLLCGYLIAARVAASHAARMTLAAAEDSLDLSEAHQARLRESLGRYARTHFVTVGAVGAVLASCTPYLIRDDLHPWIWSTWTPEFALRRYLTPIVGWFLGTYLYATIAESERISELARHLKSIDLFESEALAPFTRFGLRTALGAVGLLSVICLFLTEQGFGLLVGCMTGLAALAAAAGLLFPLRGLRDRISEEKTRELASCRDALQRARDALVEGRAIPSGHGRLADIVAYRQMVESVSEWPVDTPTVLRAAAYVLLPIAFWLSGSFGPETLLRVAEILAA